MNALRWLKNRRRERFEAVTVGLESGNVMHLPFLRFRTEAAGQEWCDRMNAEHPCDLVRYEVRPIPRSYK